IHLYVIDERGEGAPLSLGEFLGTQIFPAGLLDLHEIFFPGEAGTRHGEYPRSRADLPRNMPAIERGHELAQSQIAGAAEQHHVKRIQFLHAFRPLVCSKALAPVPGARTAASTKTTLV